MIVSTRLSFSAGEPMNNVSLQYPQILGWLQLPRWWSLTKENPQTAQPIVTQAEIQARHRVFQRAFHCAYQRFAQAQPAWVARRFDADFLRQVTDVAELPGGVALAAAWDRQFGPISPMPVRCQQMAELAGVASAFLSLYQDEVHTSAQSR